MYNVYTCKQQLWYFKTDSFNINKNETKQKASK